MTEVEADNDRRDQGPQETNISVSTGEPETGDANPPRLPRIPQQKTAESPTSSVILCVTTSGHHTSTRRQK